MNQISSCLWNIIFKIEIPYTTGLSINLENELIKLRNLIEDRTLSPVLIQRALGYYNIRDYIDNFEYSDCFSDEFLEALAQNASEFIENFNKKLWYKALYLIFKSGNSNDPNLPPTLKKN